MKNNMTEVVLCHLKLLCRLVQAHAEGNDSLVARSHDLCSDWLSLYQTGRHKLCSVGEPGLLIVARKVLYLVVDN